MHYEHGELVNGIVVGTWRRKYCKPDQREYWSGKEWIDEFLWELNQDIPLNREKCEGCNDPFCECGGSEISDPFGDNAIQKDDRKEILKLLDLSDNINKEIRKRFGKIGGDFR